MKIGKLLLLGFLFLLMLYGCTEDFYFKELKPKDFGAKSELYVEVYAELDSVYQVRLSKTIPSLGAPANFDQYVNNAKVYIKDENGEVEIPFFADSRKKEQGFTFLRDSGKYSIYKLNSKKIKPNQKYDLEIYYNGKTYLESFTSPMQKPSYLLKIDSAIEFNDNTESYETKYYAEVTIEPVMNDDYYYLVEVYQNFSYDYYDPISGTYKTNNMQIFIDQEDNSSARIPNFFTNPKDVNSEGKIIKRRVIYTNYKGNGNNQSELKFTINVAKVEKALFDYAASLEQNYYNSGSPFSEPTQLKWNLKTAKGIACGIAHSPKDFTLTF